jgi:dipeptidyl aminopeptidase/acylaminoacyl peptidase
MAQGLCFIQPGWRLKSLRNLDERWRRAAYNDGIKAIMRFGRPWGRLLTTGHEDDTDIFILDLNDPIAPINITNNPSHNTDPSWSPDGTKLLFVSDRSGNRDIYMMNSDGTNVRRITNTPEDEDDPLWLE